jgi:CHASE3 domain sensor protein
MNIQDHPPHVRKKIALGITIGVGVVLLAVMVLYYRHQTKTPTESESKLSHFYTTIKEGTQSLFDTK